MSRVNSKRSAVKGLLKPQSKLHNLEQGLLKIAKLYAKIAMQMESVAKLVPLGLKVSQRGIRAKLGLKEPEEKDELLGRQEQAPSQTAQNTMRALNRREQQDGNAIMKEIEETSMMDLQGLGEDMSERIEAMMDEVESLQEFEERLHEILGEMGLGALAGTLAEAAMKARRLADGTG